MAERPEDLNLPNAVVTRIIKEALPNGVNVGKDARLAISKAASVFVLYATSCANNNALRSKRKTITVNDVFNALEDMEFESFVDPLREDLEAHKKSQASKKSKKAAKPAKGKQNAINPAADPITGDTTAEDGPAADTRTEESADAQTDVQAEAQMDTSA